MEYIVLMIVVLLYMELVVDVFLDGCCTFFLMTCYFTLSFDVSVNFLFGFHFLMLIHSVLSVPVCDVVDFFLLLLLGVRLSLLKLLLLKKLLCQVLNP